VIALEILKEQVRSALRAEQVGLRIDVSCAAVDLIVVVDPGRAKTQVQCEAAIAHAYTQVDLVVRPVKQVLVAAVPEEAQRVELGARERAEREQTGIVPDVHRVHLALFLR
jgi:hypothetical protein